MIIPDTAGLAAGVSAAMRAIAETIILPRFNKLAAGDVRSKTHPGDVVTIADEESERALTVKLANLLPGSWVIGEEAAAANPAVLDHLSKDEPVWIIDPIDGTANFVEGNPRFAVIVALVRRGETLMGWIHDPIGNSHLWAARGEGAWLIEAGAKSPQQVRVPPPPGDELSTLIGGIYNRDMVKLKGKFAQVVRIGSSAHDYWSITDGRMHVLSYRRLKPWDHAAGLLIHGEAGGYNSMVSGEKYSPAKRDQIGLLCAPTQKIWARVISAAGGSE